MKYFFILIVLTSFFININICSAQTLSRYNTFSYSVNQGLLQSTILDTEIDQHNFCWISFSNGIQKFDGKNFTLVPVQKGLPDDKFVYFFKTKQNELLISHSKGISRYNINSNKFELVYNKNGFTKRADPFIGEDDNLIYFYSDFDEIVAIDNRSYKIVSLVKLIIPNFNAINIIIWSRNIINHKTAFQVNSAIYLWDLQKNQIASHSDSIPYLSPFFLHLKNDNEIYFYTYKKSKALETYNFIANKITTLPIKEKENEVMYRCNIFDWQKKTLVSFQNRIYEIDETKLMLKTELVNFQNQPVASNYGISQIKSDNYGNLILQTINGGIVKVICNNYPIKYFGIPNVEANNIASILPDKINNRILCGSTGNGLLVFDTQQHLIKHIKFLPGQKKSYTPNNIIKDANGNYILFIRGEANAWQINSDFSKIISIKILYALPIEKNNVSFFGNFIYKNSKEAIIQSETNLYNVKFNPKKIEAFQFSDFYTMGALWHNTFIVSHANDELIFVDSKTFKVLNKVSLKNTGYVRCFAKIGNPLLANAENKIYMGTNNGIFVIDTIGNLLHHLTKENGLPDNCIYAMQFDAYGALWCSTNKGVFKLNKDNSILQINKEDGLQENEFNTNVTAKTDDGEIYFGGVNGVSSFYPDAITSFTEQVILHVAQIKVNNKNIFVDSASWNINNINLPYNQNQLSFDFIAIGASNPDQYIYQYKMEGIDKEWLHKNDLQTVRYFLPPGKYVFKIYASRFLNKEVIPIKEIFITINAPFWKTWWFILLWILLFAILFGYIINLINKRKYQNKMQELLGNQKVQFERERISRDLHDSVGAYANAVLYKTELLDNVIEPMERMELMQDLKFASKDIISSLRETVWALKKENYTGEECIVRIRNFIQPLAKYYNHINFKIDNIVSIEMVFHYTAALNLVRIIQEALTNSIKHAKAKNIHVGNIVQNDKWIVTIKDDGIGFDYRKEKELETGNGLENIERRALDANFKLEVITTMKGGTSISVII